jgi:hypothetical protein
MYLHARLAITKGYIVIPQGTSRVCVESVTHDELLSNAYEDQNSIIFSFTLPAIRHLLRIL